MVFPVSDFNVSDSFWRTLHLHGSNRLPASSQTLGRQLAVLLLVALLMSSAVVTCICTSVGLSEYHLLVNFGDACPTGLQMS